MTLQIETPSRLHFGLLNTGRPDRPTFCGAGLMIERPGLALTAQPAREMAVCGDVDRTVLDRTVELLRRCTISGRGAAANSELSIAVERCPPLHVGLGTGTQLALAVAKLSAELHQAPADLGQLVRITGRGQRSGIGIKGFDRGGFIVDSGRGERGDKGPAAMRLDFPIDWPILVLRPQCPVGLSGALEARAIAESLNGAAAASDAVVQLVLLGMVPAIQDKDYLDFADSLYEYNRRAGEQFAAAQGGAYAHPRIAALIEAIRKCNLRAVGQSSWGPTVFAIAPDADQAKFAGQKILRCTDFPTQSIEWTRADNVGARLGATKS